MTHTLESGASFLAPVSGAGFWCVCHWHKTRLGDEVIQKLKQFADIVDRV